MRRIITTFSFILVALLVNAQLSDSEMQDTYWKYRDQMKKYFMKIGIDNGESIPMTTNGLNYAPNGLSGSTAHWRDGTITQG